MAVDFSLLPNEEPVPDQAPSRLVWSIVFLLMALVLVFAVLAWWPKDLPTHTLKFWTTLVLFPVGLPALLVLRHFSHYEGYKLDIELRNEVVRDYRERVFEAASRPLALLGTAYRFSSSVKDNDVAALLGGAIALKTRGLIIPDHEPAKVRWLDVPGLDLAPGGEADDALRQRIVTAWLFNELLSGIEDEIRALPTRSKLQVYLRISNPLSHADNEALWQTCWQNRSLSPAHVLQAPSDFDLYALDGWLDQIIEGTHHEARLIVAVQLHPLLHDSPKSGSAEAGAVVLLAPASMRLSRRIHQHALCMSPCSRHIAVI